MENMHVLIETIHPYRPLTARTTDRSNEAVRELFVELFQVLERLKDSPRAGNNEGSLERWEDEDHIYLETDLASAFAQELDVNVHDGRVYIRLAR